MSAATARATRTERPPYLPRGAAWELLHSHAPEVLISGPAGTGKSVACLWKLHLCATEVPGFRGLLCRRTRKSLTDSALVTLERDVLPAGHESRGRVRREGRHSYRYANGSEVVVGGLDDPQRVMSTDYDLVYVQEATEATEEAADLLTTRLRNGRLGYQQLLMDCNPDRPTHWLKARCDRGRCRMLHSRHEDNPLLYDAAAGGWTPFGLEYLSRLDALTGPRLLRLRHGRWAGAEGVVYPGWDPAVHLIDPFDVPRDWPRVWSIDFGYTNPFCCLCCAIDGDGRLYVYRQFYRTKRLVSEHAERLLAAAASEPAPAAVLADPEDREGRETLAAAGIGTVAAYKGKGALAAGVQMVERRLRRAGDGRPRLYVLRGSLEERDPELAEARRPACLEDEFEGYVWDHARDRPAPNQDSHALDALRYLVFALDSPREPDDEAAPLTVYVA